MGTHDIAVWQNAETERLRLEVADAQHRLAQLEVGLTADQRNVQVIRALLFTRLRADYNLRDRLRLIVNYRKTFLDKILHENRENAAQVREQFARAQADAKREYEAAAAEYSAKKQLTAREEEELKILWKKLVKLFHPDRVYDDAARQSTYEKLTQAINAAKERGDLDTLCEIVNDPDGFIRKQGWAAVDLAPERDSEALRRQLSLLQQRIAEVVAETGRIQRSDDYQLFRLWQKDVGLIDHVVRDQKEALKAECSALVVEARQLGERIEQATGESPIGVESGN